VGLVLHRRLVDAQLRARRQTRSFASVVKRKKRFKPGFVDCAP
jgi:hypothetical protein